ncbi:hypothetical protein D3C87_1411550 [compost metagenome]
MRHSADVRNERQRVALQAQGRHARQILQAIDRKNVQLDLIVAKEQMSEMAHVPHHLWQRRQQIVLQIEITHLFERVEERQMPGT